MSNEEKNTEALRRAWWLARKELQRTWLSYPVTGVFTAFLGLLAAGWFVPVLGAAGSRADVTDTFILDFLFLITSLVLVTNYFSRDYLASWFDTFSRRLTFLRSLPISAREVAMNRALTMLPALAINSFVFFLALYPLPVLVSGQSPVQLGAVEYLWFALTWVGITLLLGGHNLYLELSLHGKPHNLLYFGICGFVLVLLGLLKWLFDVQLVLTTVTLAREYGPLPAALALLAGAVGFALWARAAERRLERRDLSP